ncbi:Ca(2+)-dependent cysteine protease [Dissophora ornata]|nr:Ca(2+)-dependent cysteine protease [Dissophora ornata]
MYPGQYRPPAQHHPQQYAPPPGQHPPPAVYAPPSPYGYPGQPPSGPYPPPGQPPPAPGYSAYPPPQAHYAPPTGPLPPQAHYAPPAGPPPPPGAPYGAPAYPPPASSLYGPPAASPYPPPAASPYGAPPPVAYSPYGAPPAPIPQHMIAPMNVPPPPQGWAMYQDPRMVPPVNFQLSNCQGRKRALFIGINYFRQRNELRGCINDVKNIKAFIIRQFGFREEDCVTLTDDQSDPTRIPTKANMLAGMQWLVRDARANDSFFFHYSGHGGQTEDLDGDEDDGFDETIYPVDHEKAGVIVDDLMHDIMVRSLPPGCRLTAVMDCCHSGSALDLPYIYSTTGQLKDNNLLGGVGSGVLNAGKSYLRGDLGGMLSSFGGIGKRITNPSNREEVLRRKSSPADCIMFSGLTARPNQTYIQLLNSIREILRTKYEQKPQLSSSHPVDLNLLFTM